MMIPAERVIAYTVTRYLCVECAGEHTDGSPIREVDAEYSYICEECQLVWCFGEDGEPGDWWDASPGTLENIRIARKPIITKWEDVFE